MCVRERGGGGGFPEIGSKNRDRSVSKGLKREARNCQQRTVKRPLCPRGIVWAEKVRISGILL